MNRLNKCSKTDPSYVAILSGARLHLHAHFPPEHAPDIPFVGRLNAYLLVINQSSIMGAGGEGGEGAQISPY